MKKSIASVLALALVTGTVVAKESSSSHGSSSCSKSIEKRLHRLNKKLKNIEQLELRLNKLAPTPITQKKIDTAGGTLVLHCSGDYCLTENVTGTIVIEADSVCLDLCCHTIDADGVANAIYASGYQGLKVFDGRIINAADTGILIDNYSAVELFKLVMSNNAVNAIYVSDSTDLSVHDVDVINDNLGERALWFDTCDNIAVHHVNASGFLSTIGAVVQLDSCIAATVQDVDATYNTKSVTTPIGSNDPATAIVCANESTGVDFVRVKANNNTVNTTAVGDRRFAAIALIDSPSCSLHACETCNNVDINGDVGNDLDNFIALDRALYIGFSDNVIVTEHQANNNSCTQVITSFRGIAPFLSNDLVFDGCQANNNFAQELTVVDTSSGVFLSACVGFWLQNTSDNVMRNCQANNNRVAFGGDGRDPSVNKGVVCGILLEASEVVIDNCQANQNTMEDAPVGTRVIGIDSLFATNVTVVNSSADDNTGGDEALGIRLVQFSDADLGTNIQVLNCSASANGNIGISIGDDLDRDEIGADVTIIDSVCNNNGNQPGYAAGIIVQPLIGGTSNVVIKGCQIYDTSSSDDDATGIIVTNATNVVIEDTNVFNTTADGIGHGILFDTVTDSKIIRTQVHGNQDRGVELVGVNTNVAILDSIAIENDVGFSVAAGSTLVHGIVQGNRALGNTSIGFEHAAVLPAPFDTGYQSNYAQDNGTNYSISNVIQIHTYTIPTAQYVFTTGGTNFPTQTNISAS